MRWRGQPSYGMVDDMPTHLQESRPFAQSSPGRLKPGVPAGCVARSPRSNGGSLTWNSAPGTTGPDARTGSGMVKTIRPYDACWKATSPCSRHGKADLHGGQHQGNKGGGGGSPGEVVAEKAAAIVPAAEMPGEAVDGVDAGRAESGAQEVHSMVEPFF